MQARLPANQKHASLGCVDSFRPLLQQLLCARNVTETAAAVTLIELELLNHLGPLPSREQLFALAGDDS